METIFLGFVYRWRWRLALLAIAMTAAVVVIGAHWVTALSQGVGQLRGEPPGTAKLQMFDPRVEIWFESDSDAVRAHRLIDRQLLTDDAVFIAFEDRSDPYGVFGASSLATINRLTHALMAIPNVRDVRSLTKSLSVRWDDAAGKLEMERIFDGDPVKYTDAERTERIVAALGGEWASRLLGAPAVRQALAAHPELEKRPRPHGIEHLVSHDARTTALLVQVLRPRVPPYVLDGAFGPADSKEKAIGVAVHVGNAQTEVVREIERVLAQETGREFHVAGLPILQKRFQEAGQADMVWAGLMFGVIALVLFAIFRRAAGVVLPMSVVVAALVGMQGASWASGDLLNNLTAICPHIVITVAIAHSIHQVASYYALRPRYRDKEALIVEVLRRNTVPLFLASVTTAVGFLSLTANDSVPMQMLGYTAAFGEVFGYLWSMTVVPAALSLMPVKAADPGTAPRADHTPSGHGWEHRLVAFGLRRRRSIVAFTILATAGAIFGMTRLDLATDAKELLSEKDPVRKDLEWIGQRLGGTGYVDLLFESRDRIVSSREFMSLATAFQHRLEDEARDPRSPLHLVTHFESPAPMLRDILDSQSQGDQRASGFSPQMSRFIFMLSAFGTADMRAFRITARVETAPTLALLAAFDRIEDIAAREFPALAGTRAAATTGNALSTMTLTGKFYLFTTMMDRFSRGLVVSLAITLAAITLLILFIYRSLVITLTSLASNVLPIALPLGFYGIVGLPLDGPAIIVAAIALGVVLDDTIYLLTAYTRARRAGTDPAAALHEAFNDVGTPCTWTNLVLVLGFSALLLSDFRPNAVIGQLGVIMILMGWLAEFLITPAVLSSLDRGGRRRAPGDRPRAAEHAGLTAILARDAGDNPELAAGLDAQVGELSPVGPPAG